jgi:hypothetical protein
MITPSPLAAMLSHVTQSSPGLITPARLKRLSGLKIQQWPHPAKVMVGNSVLHPVSADSPLNEFALIFKQRNPTMNSGVFAMCWAFTQGYDEIYTVGIDLVWDRELLAYVNNMFKKYPNQKVYKVSKTSWLPCEVKEP